MTNQVDQIKDRLDVVDVIKGYVRLKKAGNSHKGLCPFHTEKTPSFNVSQERQMWYCFGCGKGGDVFSFLQEIEGMEFPDALRLLADRAGVKLKKEDPRLHSKRKNIYELLDLAAMFFTRQLEGTTGKAVIKYLEKRGLSLDTIKEWRLGYAPDEWRSLYSFLKQKGYTEQNIEEAGLIVRSQNREHSHHDRFRHRVMFPITDAQGQIIGFSARVFDLIKGKTVGEAAGKYINTPATSVYDKSYVLYGIDKARLNIKAKDLCLVAEGNLDVILAHQAGSTNVIAVSGTALSNGHLSIIKRYTNNLALCFDSDDAGEKASQKGAHSAIEKGFNVSIIELPAGKDVADVIVGSAKKWNKIIDKPTEFLRFVINTALKKFSPKDIEGKKAISLRVLESVRRLPSPIEKEHWIGELAIVVGISESALKEELKSMKIDQDYTSVSSIKNTDLKKEKTVEDKLEEYLLAMLLKYPEGKKHLKGGIDFVKSPEVKTVIADIVGGGDGQKITATNKRFASVVLRATFLESTITDEEAEFTMVIRQLKKRMIKNQLQIIETDLRMAERQNDTERTMALLTKFNKFSQELITNEKGKQTPPKVR